MDIDILTEEQLSEDPFGIPNYIIETVWPDGYMYWIWSRYNDDVLMDEPIMIKRISVLLTTNDWNRTSRCRIYESVENCFYELGPTHI